MGFNIGSLVSGLNLPKIQLGSAIEKLSKSSLAEGIKTLAKVAGDTFLKPSTDGKGIFQSEVNIFGMRLPNPVNVLAEKLLGMAGDKLRELGYNTDAISDGLGGGKRDVVDAGEVDMPALNDRVREYAPEAPAPRTRRGGARQESGGSTAAPKVSSGGSDIGSTAIEKGLGSLGSLDSEINDFLNGSKELNPTDMLRMQQKIQRRNEMFQMISQIMNLEHETKKGIIQNIR